MRDCEVCGQPVLVENMVRHLRRAHPKEAAESGDHRARTAVRMQDESDRKRRKRAAVLQDEADRSSRTRAIVTIVAIGILAGSVLGASVFKDTLFPPPPKPPPPKENRYAVITTSYSSVPIVLELYEDKAPATTANFIKLAKQGFYDGQYFHRVIKDFMNQAGDPNTKDSDPSNDGQGDPGYSIPDEASALALKHEDPGVLSMANSGPNTGGSQFFITVKATPWLDCPPEKLGISPCGSQPANHAIFGHVRTGMDTVTGINNVEVDSTSHPVTTVYMTSVRIKAKCDAIPGASGC